MKKILNSLFLTLPLAGAAIVPSLNIYKQQIISSKVLENINHSSLFSNNVGYNIENELKNNLTNGNSGFQKILDDNEKSKIFDYKFNSNFDATITSNVLDETLAKMSFNRKIINFNNFSYINQKDSIIKDNISISFDFNNLGFKKRNVNIKYDDIKPFISVENINRNKVINNGFYTLEQYDFDLFTNYNSSSQKGDFILFSNEEKIEKLFTKKILFPGQVTFRDYMSIPVVFDGKQYNNVSSMISDIGIDVIDRITIGGISFSPYSLPKKLYGTGYTTAGQWVLRPASNGYTEKVWVPGRYTSKYYIDDNSYSSGWVHNYEITLKQKYNEKLSLLPKISIIDSKENKNSYVNVITSSNVSKMLKIDLEKSNKYSNNGSVWTEKPKLKFSLNEELLIPAYELFKLKELHNYIEDILTSNNNLSNREIKSLRNLDISIMNRSDTYSNFNKQLNDLLTNGKDIPYKPNEKKLEIYDIYESIDGYGVVVSDNINEWDEQWNVIVSTFENNDIVANYLTPDSKNVKSIKIWSKESKKFNDIFAVNNPNGNENYIYIRDLISQNNASWKSNSISQVKFNTGFDNVKINSNGFFCYDFLYRENAKNYQLFDIETRKLDSRSIQIPTNKYASEVVLADNNFVDASGGEILQALNNVIKTDSNRKVFSQVSTINDDTNITRFSNWNDGLDYFGIPHLKNGRPFNERGYPSFSRNNSDGIFYVIAKIDNWKLDGDKVNNFASGDFSKKFVDSLRSNKDIFELDLFNNSGNQGFFLIKVKSNLTTTNINPINDLETWNPNFTDSSKIRDDIRNPLNIFNTDLNNINLLNFFKDKNNLNLSTISETKEIDDGTKIETTIKETYSIDRNKNFTLLLDSFGGIFTQDYYLYEEGLNDDNYQRGEIPSLEQDFLKKVFYSFWNNHDGDIGKIVYRYEDGSTSPYEKRYKYALKDEYDLYIKENDSYYSEYTKEYSAYIKNKGKNSFSLDIKIGEIINMYEDQYSENNNELLKNEWLRKKDDTQEYIKKNFTSVRKEVQNKNDGNSQTNSGKQISNVNTGALVGGVSSGILILIITLLLFLFWRSNKKRRMLFGDVDVEKKDSKGDK